MAVLERGSASRLVQTPALRQRRVAAARTAASLDADADAARSPHRGVSRPASCPPDQPPGMPTSTTVSASARGARRRAASLQVACVAGAPRDHATQRTALAAAGRRSSLCRDLGKLPIVQQRRARAGRAITEKLNASRYRAVRPSSAASALGTFRTGTSFIQLMRFGRRAFGRDSPAVAARMLTDPCRPRTGCLERSPTLRLPVAWSSVGHLDLVTKAPACRTRCRPRPRSAPPPSPSNIARRSSIVIGDAGLCRRCASPRSRTGLPPRDIRWSSHRCARCGSRRAAAAPVSKRSCSSAALRCEMSRT